MDVLKELHTALAIWLEMNGTPSLALGGFGSNMIKATPTFWVMRQTLFVSLLLTLCFSVSVSDTWLCPISPTPEWRLFSPHWRTGLGKTSQWRLKGFYALMRCFYFLYRGISQKYHSFLHLQIRGRQVHLVDMVTWPVHRELRLTHHSTENPRTRSALLLWNNIALILLGNAASLLFSLWSLSRSPAST